MAEELEPTTASQIDFSEEVAALEAELEADETEETTDEPTEDEESGEETGDEGGEEAEGDQDADEADEEGGDDTEGEAEGGEETEGAEEESGEATIYTLVVNGREVEVDGEEELAKLAQRGLAADEKFEAAHHESENAQFTMNAMLRDPMGFLQNVAAKQNGGDYEAARMQIGKIAENFLTPIYKELAAKPDEQRAIKAERERDRALQTRQGQTQNTEPTYTQEDLTWIQNLTQGCNAALEAEDLPAGDDAQANALRKRMADLMMAAEDRRENMDPRQAAQIVKRERDEYREALGQSAPQGRKGKKPSKAAVKEARGKRSQKKKGAANRGKKRGKAAPKTFSGRDFVKSLDSAFELEP